MSDMTTEQILREFERQVRLCSGIGQREMLRIVSLYWAAQPHEHEPAIDPFQSERNICLTCGLAIRRRPYSDSWTLRPVAVPPNSVCNDVEPLDSAGGIRL